MTYEEFVSKAKTLCYIDADCGEKKDRWADKVTKAGDLGVSVSWSTGGVGGGSCWDEGESHHYAIEGETEPDFTQFDDLILSFSPNITLVDYREIKKIIQIETWSENEYYGNSSSYAKKFAYLKDIYNAMKDKELI